MAEGISWVESSFFVLILVWLVSISYFLVRTLTHYNKLIKNTDKKNLQTVFEDFIKESLTNQHKVQKLETKLGQQEQKQQLSIQKISLVRFNPFSNTGGEQSFVIGLLDHNNSGVVLTSLQNRNNSRWYAKRIKDGKGLDFELSKEEEEAIKKATTLT